MALVSDTRVSGVSHGAIGVHCAPEAAIGGPIGLVEDGDTIGLDLLQGTIDWDVSEAVVNERREKNNLFNPPISVAIWLIFRQLSLKVRGLCEPLRFLRRQDS